MAKRPKWAMHPELDRGFNDKTPVYYTFKEDVLDNETYCDNVQDVRIGHTGWFCDPYQHEKARGIIASVVTGGYRGTVQYVAGYRLADSGQTVWFTELHDTAREAALMADEHARVLAESEHEYQTQWREARDIEDANENLQMTIARLYALRNHSTLGKDARDELRDAIAALRDGREKLARDYPNML